MLRRYAPRNDSPHDWSAGMRVTVAELLAAALLLLVVVLLRTYQLGSDSPTGLSISSDVETDPPQYTIFARNHALTDDYDPFDDARRTVFLKSSMTLLATAVFGMFGVGLWQSAVPGLVFSVGALLLFWLFVRRAGGRAAGLAFLLLAALDYNLIFFGRLSFLEHALLFWAFLGLVIVAYARAQWLMFAAGVALGIGMFFGKALGVVFLFPFACWFGYQLLFAEDRRAWVWRGALFAAGVTAVLAGWYLFIYAPAQTVVAGYYSEQAIDLYGAPEGLQSIWGFLNQLVTFGEATHLFPRMRSSGILGAVFLLVVLGGVAQRGNWREIGKRVTPEQVFLAAMIVAWYGSLMIWNYRPLRYQLVLIYAFHAAAAMVLGWLWEMRRKGPTAEEGRLAPYVFVPVGWLVLMPVIFQVWNGLGERFKWNVSFENDWMWVALMAAAGASGVWWGMQALRREWIGSGKIATQAAVVLVLAANSFVGAADYHYWTRRPTFTARDNSRDLAMTVGLGAVLSGPYAPLLAMENRHGVIIHMFGVAEADTLLFSRLPITHLLLDEANEKKAKADYPQVMDSAVHVLTYHVGVDKVRLFRVAGHTGNGVADAYVPTDLEKGIDAYHEGNIGMGHALVAGFLEKHPQNLSAYLAVGEVADADDQFDLAEQSLAGAVSYSPTNYNLHARIAELYKKGWEKTGDVRYREESRRHFDEAIRLAPTVGKLKSARRELDGARGGMQSPVEDSAAGRKIEN